MEKSTKAEFKLLEFTLEPDKPAKLNGKSLEPLGNAIDEQLRLLNCANLHEALAAIACCVAMQCSYQDKEQAAATGEPTMHSLSFFAEILAQLYSRMTAGMSLMSVQPPINPKELN